MAAIHIETMINSETLHLPQLKPLVGKKVEITVREKCAPIVTPGGSDWAGMEMAFREIEDYDFEAWRALRDTELRQADQNGP
jgi:hypothetical protein